jgi:hypothetical protein
MFDKNKLLNELETLKNNPVDFNLMLDVIILMYQEKCIYDGKIELCKAIKNGANTGLRFAKFFIDIFIEIDVFYATKQITQTQKNLCDLYHVREIKKEFFKITDLYYILNNNLTYFTYQKLHRKNKLKQIFGDEFK